MRLRLAMMPIGVAVACMVIATGWSGTCCADEATLGVVRITDVYRLSKTIQREVENIKRIEGEARVQLEKISHDVRVLEKKLKEGEKTLGEADKKKLMGELKAKQEHLEAERQAARVKLGFEKKSAQTKINVLLNEAIKKIAQERKLKAIISDRVLLYHEGIPDLTDKLIEELDSRPAAEQPASQPPPGTPDEKKPTGEKPATK